MRRLLQKQRAEHRHDKLMAISTLLHIDFVFVSPVPSLIVTALTCLRGFCSVLIVRDHGGCSLCLWVECISLICVPLEGLVQEICSS